MIAQDFIHSLFTDLEDDEVVCFQKVVGEARHQSARIPPAGSDGYFCVSTVKPAQPLRRRKEDLMLSYVVVLDDIGTKIDEPPIEPTYKLESSAGNFQWGYAIEAADPHEFAAVLQALAEAGFTDRGATGAARVVRYPGSVNTKPGRNNFEARVTEWHPERRWELQALAQAFGVTPGEAEQVATVTTLANAPEDTVLDWLVEQSLVTGGRRDEFYEIICPWHSEHTTGDDLAGYSPVGYGRHPALRGFNCFHEHCQARGARDFLQWVVEHGGPQVGIGQEMPRLPPVVPEAPEWMRLRHNHDPDEVNDLAKRFRFATQDGRYYHADTPEARYIKPSNMPLAYPKPIMTTTPAGRPTTKALGAVAMGRIGKVTGVRFHPGRGLEWAEDGFTWLNSYRPVYHAAARPSLDLLNVVLRRIADREEDQEWLRRWLAYKIQHPASTGPAVLSIAADSFGTGRGTFVKLAGKLFGERYTAEIEFAQLTRSNYQSQYNEWLAQKLFIGVKEAKDAAPEHQTSRNARVAAYEAVKTVVDPGGGKQSINRKGVDNSFEDVFTLFFVATNHADVMEIPAGDRRFFVVRSQPTLDAQFWRMVHQDIEDPEKIDEVYAALRQYDTGAYQPHETPPMTPAKEDLIIRGESIVSGLAADFVEWLPGDVIDPKLLNAQFTRFCTVEGIDGKFEYVRAELKRKHGWIRPQEPGWLMKIKGRGIRPWVLRDLERWEYAENKDIREELKKNGTDIKPDIHPIK